MGRLGLAQRGGERDEKLSVLLWAIEWTLARRAQDKGTAVKGKFQKEQMNHG